VELFIERSGRVIVIQFATHLSQHIHSLVMQFHKLFQSSTRSIDDYISCAVYPHLDTQLKWVLSPKTALGLLPLFTPEMRSNSVIIIQEMVAEHHLTLLKVDMCI
jgi:hypothetical protein